MKIKIYLVYFIIETLLWFICIHFLIQQDFYWMYGESLEIIANIINIILTFFVSYNLVKNKIKERVIYSIAIVIISYLLFLLSVLIVFTFCKIFGTCGDYNIFKNESNFILLLSISFLLSKVLTIFSWEINLFNMENKY